MTDDRIISEKEAESLARQAMKDGTDALMHAARSELPPIKLFGLFEVPGMVGPLANVAYNNLVHLGEEYLAPEAYKVTLKAGKAVNDNGHRVGFKGTISDGALQKAAAITTLGAAVAVKSGPYLNSMLQTMNRQRKEQEKLARDIAPVLDEVKGNHSLFAYLTTGMHNGTAALSQRGGNDMLYAHRKWQQKAYDANNFQNMIDLVVQAGANTVLSVHRFAGMWKHQASPEQWEKIKNDLPALPEGATQEQIEAHDLKLEKIKKQRKFGEGVAFAWNTSSTGIAEALKISNKTSATKGRREVTGLMMVMELEKQVSSGANARSFRAPGKHGRSYSLEEYIFNTVKLHYKDMADLSTDHSEVREALDDDLRAAVQPLADAVRHGEIGTFALVRLIGENKIVKNRGRSIADVEEVKGYVEELAHGHKQTKPVDVKAYLDKNGLEISQIKQSLAEADDEGRISLIAMLPQELREKVGISKEESAKVDAAVEKDYNERVAASVLGVAGMSEEELKEAGIPSSTARMIRKAAEKIERHGVEAVRELKTSAVNDNGIEDHVMSVAVPASKSFSEMVSKGREQLQSMAETGAERGFAAKEAARRGTGFAANDFAANDLDFAERELDRRLNGTHGHDLDY